MKKTVPQFFHFLLRFLLVTSVFLLVACGGASSEIPPGGDNGGNNNEESPGFEFPPEELVINLGPDLVLNDYCSEVLISAGRTSATSFEWTQRDNGPRVRNLTNANGFQVRFTPAIFSANTPDSQRKTTLRLTGRDAQGNVASDDITITFLSNNLQNNACNTPPTIQPIPNEIVQPGDAVVLTATATDAEDDTAQIEIEWRETTVPPLVLGNRVEPGETLSFTAPSTPATLSFQVTATDSDGATASSDVEVIVRDSNTPGLPNQPPVANAGEDQFLKPGDTVNMTGIASDDADGTIVSYMWT
ncbi:PKD domain-containing protein, partial [Kaarinaea lacus]